MAVSGESFYPDQLAAATGGGVGEHTMQLLLIRDPTNPYDANCINVKTVDGLQLGNLSRDNAERFAEGTRCQRRRRAR